MDSSGDYAFKPIYELATEIQTGTLSPSALMELYLNRVATFDPKLHAFVNVYADQARLAAEAADLAIKAGHYLGPLHGMPIAIKDLVEIQGQITTGGSLIWRERVSEITAPIVNKLLAAGMIIIGKTHTVEFAYGGWGTNQHCGTPRNPWDMDTHRLPGGSSSGSAVATAAGLAAAAIGSDTGGSVRVPAAFCGLVGLKTTVGLINTTGVLPLSRTLDTIGPLTRSVEDAALLFNALQHSMHATDPLPSLRNGVKNLRLAILPESERTVVDNEILACYDKSLQVLESLGAKLVEVKLPRSLADYRDATATIIGAEAYAELSTIVDDKSLQLDEHVRQRILMGKQLSARDYVLALRERVQAKCDFAVAMDSVDALLTPAAPSAAIAVADVDENTTPAYFTRFGNLLDLCGLSVPNGYTADGLPSSLLIHGRSFDEARLLRIGWAYEQATLAEKRLPAELS